MKEIAIAHNPQEYKRHLIDLMSRVDAVLSTSNVEYFGVYGTCLGAVREHGIIPWDDDIDIAVRRCDFDKTTELLNSSTGQIFVERHGFRSARLFNRLMGGDSIERQRAYIDLYVIDYAPELKLEFMWNAMWYVGLSRIIGRRTGNVGDTHPFLYLCADVMVFPFRILPTSVLERIAKWFYVFERQSSFVKLSYDANRKRYLDRFFRQTKREKFGSLFIPVPEEYDEYLTMTYGDWRIPPKEVDRASHAFDKTGRFWNVSLPNETERKYLPFG